MTMVLENPPDVFVCHCQLVLPCGYWAASITAN